MLLPASWFGSLPEPDAVDKITNSTLGTPFETKTRIPEGNATLELTQSLAMNFLVGGEQNPELKSLRLGTLYAGCSPVRERVLQRTSESGREKEIKNSKLLQQDCFNRLSSLAFVRMLAKYRQVLVGSVELTSSLSSEHCRV